MTQDPKVSTPTNMEMVGVEAPICIDGVCQVPAENAEADIPLD